MTTPDPPDIPRHTTWHTFLRAPGIPAGVDQDLVDEVAAQVELLWIRRAGDAANAGMGLLVTGDPAMSAWTTAAGVRQAWEHASTRTRGASAPLWVEIPPGTNARTIVDVTLEALGLAKPLRREDRLEALENHLDYHRPLALVFHGIDGLTRPHGERHDLAYHLGLAVKHWRAPIVFIDSNPKRHLLGNGQPNLFRGLMSTYLRTITVPAHPTPA